MKKTMCPKCSHYETCSTPCFPVAKELFKNGNVFEKNGVIFPLYNHIQFGELQNINKKGAITEADNFIADDVESPFRHFAPKLKMTGIFIQRFFFKKSFK